MAVTTRKSVAMVEQIRNMHSLGMGPRAIARCLRISRNTVKRILRECTEAPQVAVRPSSGHWSYAVDWEKVRQEYSRGVTIKILHKEWAPPEVTYKQFWHHYRRLVPVAPIVTMRLIHKPAERAFFDFAEGLSILTSEGEVIKTQFLCGVLPFSSYTWGEFVLDQKQITLMSAMERAWQFWGGVTPYVTVDNLKAGVHRAHIYDPEVNPAFCDFANHWGFAVIPARPRKPRDKASNESGIGVIQRGFFNEVRDRRFYSLSELNQVFREYLHRLNQEMMKDHGVSRRARFETERFLLKPLAPTNYETCEWRSAKVHPDCHIQLERRFYSVPHSYVGRTVRVRLTQRLVEIFSEDREPLATHARLVGRERISTHESHYPEHKVSIAKI